MENAVPPAVMNRNVIYWLRVGKDTQLFHDRIKPVEASLRDERDIPAFQSSRQRASICSKRRLAPTFIRASQSQKPRDRGAFVLKMKLHGVFKSLKWTRLDYLARWLGFEHGLLFREGIDSFMFRHSRLVH